jgi:signal transduction histidine kinase
MAVAVKRLGQGDQLPLRTLAMSARVRILAWFVVLLLVALGLSVMAVRQVLVAHINARIDAELRESAAELAVIAAGSAPDEQARTLDQILAAGVGSGVPEQNAAVIALREGRPYARSAQPVPVRLDAVAGLVAAWSRARAATFGSVQTAAGQVRYAAVPVVVPGRSGRGVLVTAIFAARDLAEAGDVTRMLAETLGLAMLVASGLAWLAAGRILAPVRRVTEVARSISDSDLTGRIPVSGDDEVSQLARTFNLMLDRLEDAFAAQRAFLDDAGHELRTPITIIRGNLELLGDDPQTRARTLALVTDELDRMTRQVDDLLTLAKASQPAFLHLAVADVAQLTDEVFAKARTLADRDWRLCARGRGRAVLDRQRITQALAQLATNAVQHTVAGDRVTIGSAVADGTARFWVQDTGDGIQRADQAHIFERFTRGSPKRRGRNGAGLGLAIVRGIAVAHHGRVEVDSTPGHGATFTLTIPMDQPTELVDGRR